MKFKINEVTTEKIVVEYEDGVLAEIPAIYGKDKAYYAEEIKKSYVVKKTISIDDIPYKKGDEGTVGDDIPVDTTKHDYKICRDYCYPDGYELVNALYLSRNGDSSAQTAVDAHIKLVNDGIPADSTTYTEQEIEAKLTQFKKDSAFIQ